MLSVILPFYPSSLPVFVLCQRRSTTERVRLSVGFPGQNDACRLGKKPSSGCVAIWPHNRPQDRSKYPTAPVPSPRSTNVLVSRSEPYLLRQPISHKVEGHNSILLYFAARRRRYWRFVQVSNHVPRVGRG